MTQSSDSATPALIKVLIAWAGTAVGSITMQGIILALTGLYTGLQLYILVRDKIVRDKPRHIE